MALYRLTVRGMKRHIIDHQPASNSYYAYCGVFACLEASQADDALPVCKRCTQAAPAEARPGAAEGGTS